MTDPNHYGSYAVRMTRAQAKGYQGRRKGVVNKRRIEVATLHAQGKLATREQRQAYALSQAVSLVTIDKDLRAIRETGPLQREFFPLQVLAVKRELKRELMFTY